LKLGPPSSRIIRQCRKRFDGWYNAGWRANPTRAKSTAAAVERTYLAADTGMATKPEPPPLSTWDVFRVAHKAIWLGTVEAANEQDAIEQVAKRTRYSCRLVDSAAAIAECGVRRKCSGPGYGFPAINKSSRSAGCTTYLHARAVSASGRRCQGLRQTDRRH
jgi:hypothetical protein